MRRTKFYAYSLFIGFAILMSSSFLFEEKKTDTNIKGNEIVLSTLKSQSFLVTVKEEKTKEKDELFTSYDFGIIEIGKSKTQEFAIKNTGNADLNVSTISSSDPQFVPTEAKEKVVPPGGFTIFDITFTPKAKGEQSAKITIINNDSDEAEFEFKVTGGDPNAIIDSGTKGPEIEVIVN